MKKILLALALVSLAVDEFSARAQEVIDPNHTVVRFHVSTGGTNFGSIDIELFDQEKPETVQNFLSYVHSGVYSNLIVHRLITNFVLQAGHVRTDSPASEAPFTSYIQGDNFGPIANEYGVGPELSNEYGTIAMARISGQANSASGNWFFNLTNNSFLDSVDGGFTVFGRVVNTLGERTGTNLLNFFNTVSTTNAAPMTPSDYFSDLPISFPRESAPHYADLYTINAEIIQGSLHSVVRFDIFTQGTNFGSIDIELFDQEKPETVRNFLSYVYGGGYSNLVLHRLDPGFVMQGGRVQVDNAASASQFNNFFSKNYGNITNEYSVGPELHNEFGTIAMARVAGDTNSAGAEFFFNLTNNVSLDTNDGGFTVFGRVINSTGENRGTNLLNFFNNLPLGTGVREAITGDPLEFFGEIPTSAFRTELITNNSLVVTSTIPPQYRDLFVVQASIIEGNRTVDRVRPTLTVDDLLYIRTSNSVLRMSGTASDNMEVARVYYSNSPVQIRSAIGKTSWITDVNLVPGTNEIAVRAVDYFGNVSTSVTRKVFYSVFKPISFDLIGKGKITGITNGQLFELTTEYQATATPARGYYFNGWRGDGYSDERTVTFVMEEGLNIIARFSKTFLGLAKGKYEGVFSPNTNGTPNMAGLISLNLQANGSFSGRLKPLGANYLIRGKMDGTGNTVITGPLGTNLLRMQVSLYADGTEGIYGYYSDGHFFSEYTLWRVQTFGKTNPAPQAGQYTFNLSPPTDTNSGVTDGSGFGTVTVDAKGKITVAGTLANGAAFKQKTALLAYGRWPFYYTAKKGDSVLGLVQFNTNDTFSADVKWFGTNFPGGINQNQILRGSPYIPPSQARLFDWTNGIITFDGAALAGSVTSDVELHEDGSFSVPSNPNNIQLNVADATGLITGSFTHSGSNAPVAIRGAVLQSSNSAAGYFPGSPHKGGFTIRRAP